VLAEYALGCCYYDGNGVTQDTIEAAKWFGKAAGQGHMYAQYDIGVCYLNGSGVPKDYIEAAKRLSLASSKGHPNAKKQLSAVEQSMTAGQIADAQILVREFKVNTTQD
jgi:TPR repeat protein